jgi:hypothetical protein
MGRYSDYWREPGTRDDADWDVFGRLSTANRERMAAGFEYLGRRPTR